MKTEVYARVRIEGIHCWQNCHIDEVSYLKYLHRHMFEFIAYAPVYHDDRDIEFIQLGHKIRDYLTEQYYSDEYKCLLFDSKSCEMLGRELIEKFNLLRVEVNEDSENGAIIYAY